MVCGTYMLQLCVYSENQFIEGFPQIMHAAEGRVIAMAALYYYVAVDQKQYWRSG